MKAVTITHQRTINRGNYEHERIEITLQEEGETAQQVLNAAKRFVVHQIAPPAKSEEPALPNVADDVPR